MLVTIRCTCFTNLHYYTYIFAIHSHVLKCSFYRATANAYARSCYRHLSVCPSACLSNAWIVTKRNNSLSPYHTAISSLLRPSFMVLSLARRLDHITPVLRSLHWLPLRRRIIFKTAVLVWKCIHGVAPPYLQEFCVPVENVQGGPRLRSASTGCVDLPRVQTSVGQCSFAFHGPTVWNSLPSALRDSSLSLNTFKRRLKTHLFGQS